MSQIDLLLDYVEMFDENFPIYEYSGEKNVNEVIKQCIKDKKPYKVPEHKDRIY
jgi:hypothetical protein